MIIARIIDPLVAALDTGLASHRRSAFWLVLACLALFLPGFFTLQPMDRDEPRFAQATKQMLETGDYIAIRFQDEARNKKPVGIYWMQAVVVSTAEALGVPHARTQIWLYRLVSLMGAISAVLLTYWTALVFVTQRSAFLAALLFASTILLGVEARLAKTDAVVLATVMAAMGALARFYLQPNHERGWRLPVIFWSAIGLGLLVKGPITPMVPLFAGLVLAVKDRGAVWFAALRPLPGLLWALLIVVPWFALIMIATQGAFLADSVGNDMLGKVSAGQESHGAPPGTYLVAFWATAWPMAPLAALAAIFAWRARREAAVAFLIAWIVPYWLVFESVPTKLPHYVLPTYPAMAILILLAFERGSLRAENIWARGLLRLVPIISLILVAAGLGLWGLHQRMPGVAAFLILPVLIWLAFYLMREISVASLARLIVSSAVLAWSAYVFVFSGIMTSGPFEAWRMSPRLAEAAHQALQSQTTCSKYSAASVGFNEPSLVFLTGTDLLLTQAEAAARFVQSGPCRVAFVDVRGEAAFKAALAPSASVILASRVQGLNLNGGRKLDMGVYLMKASAP